MEAHCRAGRNTCSIDVVGELGSAHVSGLCNWGPSTLTLRRGVYPSGIPHEEVQTVGGPDPTWELEYQHFKDLCRTGGTNIENDRWINSVLEEIAPAQAQVSRAQVSGVGS